MIVGTSKVSRPTDRQVESRQLRMDFADMPGQSKVDDAQVRRSEVEEQPSQNYVTQRLRQLQSELIDAARRSAMDEIGTAVADQLSEPMTALLLYLREIEQAGVSAPDPQAPSNRIWDSLHKAISEAERVSDLLDRMRVGSEPSANIHAAPRRGREAERAPAYNQISESDHRPSPSRPSTRLHPLTTREQEVLAQITGGATNREGSQRLGISTRTFEAHRAHIMRKLGARNVADLVRSALSESR